MPLLPVAVVIPLYNGAAWIGETLASVRAQLHAPAEIVVVDNGSSDDGTAVARRVPGVTVLARPGGGPNPARVFGYARTQAPLVAFLDQDDLWHPEHLLAAATALAADAGAPAAVAGLDKFAEGTTPSFATPGDAAPVPLDPWATFPGSLTATPSAVVMRRSALDAAGGWTLDHYGTADYFMWLRLGALGPFAGLGGTTAAMRQHARSHSARLRAQAVLGYYGSFAEATRAVAPFGQIARPHEAAEIAQRAALVQAVGSVLEGIVTGAPGPLRAGAEAFEDAARGASADTLDAVWGVVFWYLGSFFEGTPERFRAFWPFVLEHWPRTAPIGRAYLARRAGTDAGTVALAALVLRRPFNGAGRRGLAASLRHRLAR